MRRSSEYLIKCAYTNAAQSLRRQIHKQRGQTQFPCRQTLPIGMMPPKNNPEAKF